MHFFKRCRKEISDIKPIFGFRKIIFNIMDFLECTPPLPKSGQRPSPRLPHRATCRALSGCCGQSQTVRRPSPGLSHRATCRALSRCCGQSRTVRRPSPKLPHRATCRALSGYCGQSRTVRRPSPRLPHRATCRALSGYCGQSRTVRRPSPRLPHRDTYRALSGYCGQSRTVRRPSPRLPHRDTCRALSGYCGHTRTAAPPSKTGWTGRRCRRGLQGAGIACILPFPRWCPLPKNNFKQVATIREVKCGDPSNTEVFMTPFIKVLNNNIKNRTIQQIKRKD